VKISAIERLRAVAIIPVYLIHVRLFGEAFGYFAPLRRLASWAGVDLFFVISGFVVTLSLERLLPERGPHPIREPLAPEDARAMRSFYVRRLFRLAPMASCALALHLAGSLAGPLFAPSTRFLSTREWAFEAAVICTGLYNFVAPFLDRMAMAFFWTLSVEEQFYLLLPMLFVLTGTRHARTVVAAIVLLAVAVVIRPLFSPNSFQIAHCSSQYRFDALAAGVVLGLQREWVAAAARRIPRGIRRILVFLALGVIIWIPTRTSDAFALHNGLVLIWMASACLVALAFHDGRDVLAFPGLSGWLEYIGRRSYAIYVLHTAFLFLDDTILRATRGRAHVVLSSMPGQSMRFVACAAIVLVAADLAHRFIEVPFIAIGKRYVSRRTHAGEPALDAVG
jgi:peptidoglycan/LPS O-acetylase OafA/YrhL